MAGTDARRKLGDWGENVAAVYLEAHGYQIVARNWRCRQGEIDLVVRGGEELVFVEVKTRRGRGAGTPEESITPRKGRKLLELAQRYFLAHDIEDADWRVDLVAIELDGTGKLLRCEHIENAVIGW